ncbi:MAG: NYN domain-containing protein [Planctomycetia bacterium]|nr:NYN domain-containing protein [Planctomycetia bacterium]
MSVPKAPSDPKAHVAVLVDLESLARAAGAPPPAEVATALLRYAAGVGRVMLARAYADFGARVDDANALQAARVLPVLVTRGPAGEDRAHVRLAVEALEARYAGGEPDAFVLATADERLLPLVQALRGDGSDVLVVTPAAVAAAGLRGEADAAATLEEVLAGAVGPASAPALAGDDDGDEVVAPPPAPPPPPARPRAPEGRGFGPPPRDRFGAPEGRGYGDRERRRFGGPEGFAGPEGGRFGGRDEGRPGRGPREFGGREGGFGGREAPPLDFERYDWASFVRLVDELEHRLPFVGVRYLVNKVMGPRNAGIDDPRQKRELINRAVDDGVLEMYEVGNVEGRGDPVTACRLDRASPVVVRFLGASSRAPNVPASRPGLASDATEASPGDGARGDGGASSGDEAEFQPSADDGGGDDV